MYVHKYRCVHAEAGGVESPGARVTGSYELPGLDAGSQTPVLFKNSKVLLTRQPSPLLWKLDFCSHC